MGGGASTGYTRTKDYPEVSTPVYPKDGNYRQVIPKSSMTTAKKIVMVLVDEINAKIIRPGPKPEERECYEISQELRDFKPELEKLVSQVLDVES